MTSIADLDTRLGELHRQTSETPLFNPVFQLGLELSRDLESGAMSLAQLESLVEELEGEGLAARAARLGRLLEPVAPDDNDAAVSVIGQKADETSFAAFAERWAQPSAHIVFTAHPTFLLTNKQTEAVAEAVEAGSADPAKLAVPAKTRDAVTLESEHQAAMAAIARGQSARDRIHRQLFAEAQKRWPGEWRKFRPLAARFATWVGYDMDGRTDISWNTSIRFRLQEKAQRLSSYASMIEGDAPAEAERLAAAAKLASEMAVIFAQDLSEPDALSKAANTLTADHPDKLISLEPMIATLESMAESAEEEAATNLLVAAAAMRADGLGMGWVHFRVNSSQLHNAIRQRLGADRQIDIASQGAIGLLREAIADLTPLSSNFAALAIESSTAIRQFLAMVQISQHIDADSPIRMLIAECEQPSTVLAALYFARMFGVEDLVDVSPLFETQAALEHGGRFLDALLSEEVYRAYARKRGRVCIQTGFSDAGRFVGQLPASLAIERLQGRLADAMRDNGMDDVAALIFNTHGESMGRGAHPNSIQDRIDWALTPWARRRFVRAGIRLEPEMTFQGGDGYLFFGTDALAQATLTRLLEAEPNRTDPDVPTDEFYRRTDLSLDFYRAIRRDQLRHLNSRTYSRAVTAFGLGMLNQTGSRVSRRQSDLASDRDMSLRQIRAIPHNAVLQQLGYPVNVITGVGNAAEGAGEELPEVLASSPRGRQLFRMVRAANALASIKTVAAYGELFNSAYWASRPYRGTEQHLEDPCLKLAQYLTKDDRTGVFRRLASRLRVDAMKLYRLLGHLPDEAPLPDREHTRRSIGVAQALRLALLQHMFLKVVSVPSFSRANDISRDDVLEMVFTLRMDDALAQLRRAFPTSYPSIGDFTVSEASDYPDQGAAGYGSIHEQYIDPLEEAYGLTLRISTAIANVFGAHG
jgi:phosphoenolpyruvate carboxylase